MLGLGTQRRSCYNTEHPEYQRKHQATFRPALRAPMTNHFPFPSQVPHVAATFKYSFAKSCLRHTAQAWVFTASRYHTPGRMSATGLVSRAWPVQTAMRNGTRDEGGPFEVGNQVLTSSHRKLLSSKATVVNVAETSGHDPGRHGRERRAPQRR